MLDILAESMKLWRRGRYEYLTGSRFICKSPGFLIAVKMIGTAAATSTLTLHDGENSNEAKIVDLNALVKGTDWFNPPSPVPFNRGLYAELGITTSSATVIFIAVKE